MPLAAALAGLAVAWPTATTTPTTTTTALNFQPSGGLGTNSTPPFYHPLSDFDFQSLVRLTCSSHLSLLTFNDTEPCIKPTAPGTRPLPLWPRNIHSSRFRGRTDLRSGQIPHPVLS